MGENSRNWDLLLPRAEFAYNCSVNRSTGKSPFEIVHGYKPNRPLDLIPALEHTRVSESAESFAQHVKDLHHDISQKINLSNNMYKQLANSHRRLKEFAEGDQVMIRLRPERFPPGAVRKLHARGAGPFRVIKKVGPNAYVLELPPELGISSTFNISDLTEYREPALIPSEPFGPTPSFESDPVPEYPQNTWPERKNRVERILDDQAISTRNRGYQRYLVRWQGQPESEDSWISRSDLQQIDPDLLEQYQSRLDPHSTESSSSHSGGIGAGTRIMRRLQGSIWI